MNFEQLLAHFDRVSEAPDAVPRLRRFILDLAVRGKLAPQDPNDVPASKLLKRIQAEKVRRIQNGELRNPRAFDFFKEREDLFSLPGSWVWCRLSDVGAIIGGGTPSGGDADNFTDGGNGIPWLTPADLGKHQELYISHGARDLTEKGFKSSSATMMPEGSVLFTSRAPIGYVAIAGNAITTNQGFKSVVPYVPESSRYVALYLRAFGPWVDSRAPGTTFREVSGKIVSNLPFPLPPLAEQYRIVAKVDELMVLCDQLEAVREERERRRDRLAAVSLNQIGKPTEVEEVFREHARFHLANLSNFTTRPDQIHVLRKMILDLAVKGKLVSQNSNDEPASVLLNRIQSDKLGKDITKSLKPLLSTSMDKGLPYKSPKGWEWVCLQDIFCSITDGDHLPPLKTENGVPFLVIGNVRKGVVDFSGCRHVSESYYSELASIRRPQKGDILYTLVGSYGIPVLLVDDRPFCVQRHIGILRPSIRIDTKFLARVLASGLVYEQATNCATGIAQKTVPLAGLRKIRIPLPPLAEQHRIVAKVDELIALCDRLEVQLTSVQTESHRLLEALLHQVMEPALEEVSA